MPKKGNYTLALIDATTKQPFKEHAGRNGLDANVEAEPGVEYFMRLQNHSTHDVWVEYEVDGVDLGYDSIYKPGQSGHDGLWSFVNNQSLMKSLKFNKAISHSQFRNASDNNLNDSQIGVIEVSIYEHIVLDGYYYEDEIKTQFTGNGQIKAQSIDDSKKLLKSQPGIMQEKRQDDGKRRNGMRGRKLETIKVKYCSAVGLIVDGVLPKPPAWEWFKMVKPQAVCTSEPEIEPTIFTKEVHHNGNLTESMDYEMFDLTSVDTE
jgi:hypothetical protein